MTHAATAYARDVVDGRIVTGALVRHACQRHLDDLAASADPEFPYVFDEGAADHVLDFCPLCRHFEGEWAGDPFEPEPWQVFILASVFGWLRRADDTRRFRKAFIMVGRKNGKTLMAAAVGYYCLLLDGEAGAQVISFANSLDQAEATLFRAAEQVRERSPALRRKVESTKNNLFVSKTASFWRPLADNARAWDGLNAHLGLSDETHEHDGKTYRVVESSQGARSQPLMFAITTAGFDQAGFGGQLYGYMKEVVDPKSPIQNEEAFTYIAQLDFDDDADEDRHWIKANPNLDVSVKLDFLRGEHTKSLGMASERGNFLVKHLNIWTSQTERWLDMDLWDACATPVDPTVLRGERAIAGIDLASTTDLTAVVLLLWQRKPMVVIPFFWHPEDGLRRRADRDRVPYEAWVDEGLIELTPGDVVDYDFIEHRIIELSSHYQISEIAYDPHHALHMATRLQARGFEPIKIPQTFAVLHEACRRLETLLAEEGLAHGGHSVLRWCASNASVKRNAAGEIKPVKADDTKRIDGIAALVNAIARAIRQAPTPEADVVFHVPPSSRQRDFMGFEG